jgi:hemoglobin/transferrin/lactoferrin receptor protein
MAGTKKRAFALRSGVSALTLFSGALLAPASAQVTVLDAITIIATKTEEFAINALAPVSTVREEQIQQLQPTRTHQILFGIPGVTTEATAQDPATAINIRGLQDFGRVAVYIDGARQNYARLGHDGAGSFFLETEVLADADIVRGPTSNIYGSGAIGGVVSFRTKDVNDILLPGQNWGIQTNATIETNGFNGVGSIFAAARISPNVDFIIGGSVRDQDTYSSGNGTKIYNSGQEVQTFLSKLTFRPAEDHQIKLGTVLYNADWKSGVAPGSGLPATSNERGWNSFNISTTANWKYRPAANPLIDLDANAYWNRVDVTSRLIQYFGAPSATTLGIFGPVGTRTNYLIDTFGFDVNNTSRFESGPFRHALTYGVDIFNDRVDNTATAGFGAGYNPRGDRTVGGAFMQWKANYSTWLEVIGGLRYDSYTFSGLNVRTGNQVENDGDRLSPKLTIGITPFAGFQPYVSYAEGYRAPAITETLVSQQHPGVLGANFLFLPNPNLRPEVGKNTEIGMNYKRDDLFVTGDKLRIKTSFFRNNVEDFIDTVFLPISGAPGATCPLALVGFPPAPAYVNCAQYQNIANARIEGFEFEGVYDRGDWFVGLAGHIINGRDTDTGNPLSKIPSDMVATTIGARFWDRKLQVAVRWAAVAAKPLSDLPPGTAAAQATGSYNLVNLYVGYQVDPTMQLAFSVENLLDEQYTIYTHEYPSPGLTAKISLRKTFGPAPDVAAAANLNTASLRPQALR